MSDPASPTTESGRRLVEALAAADVEAAASALVSAVFVESNLDWLYEQCLAAADLGPWDLAAVAATCIGHLARLRGYIRDDMLPRLEALAERDDRIRSYAEDAADDVRFAISRRSERRT